MSLKAFHYFFVICSIILSFYFGYWCMGEYQDFESTSYLLMGLISLSLGFVLCGYFIWMLKKLQKFSFLTLAAILLFKPTEVLACAVCVGDPNSPMVKGANAGVWLLLVVVATMLSGFGGVILFWIQRAKKLGQAF